MGHKETQAAVTATPPTWQGLRTYMQADEMLPRSAAKMLAADIDAESHYRENLPIKKR